MWDREMVFTLGVVRITEVLTMRGLTVKWNFRFVDSLRPWDLEKAFISACVKSQRSFILGGVHI